MTWRCPWCALLPDRNVRRGISRLDSWRAQFSGELTITRNQLFRRGCRLACLVIVVQLVCVPAQAVESQTDTVTVQPLRLPLRIHAYAAVTPISSLSLRAPERGVLSGLRVSPGQSLPAGAVAARLIGPQRASSLAALRLKLSQAKVQLRLAGQEQSIVRRKFHEQLATRRDVDRADAAFDQARDRLEVANAALKFARQASRITVPIDGTVASLAASNGEWVQAGQVVAILVPSRRVWLMATLFGQDARRVKRGMAGSFQPPGGGAPVAVHIVRILPVAMADGGRRVALRPDSPASIHWRVGEAGRLTLVGPNKTFIPVPSRALVLDRGHWWVLVETPRGALKRAVVPGPSQGDETLIRSGLKAGEHVVVTQAYLHFHRDFAKHYQPPD